MTSPSDTPGNIRSAAASYDRLLIYVFSGTGNARKAAEWILALGRAQGLETHIQNIEFLPSPEIAEVPGRTLIGFCYPTHGFIAPWLVLKFLWRFPRLGKVDVFFLNTRAGFGLYRIHNGPGISGLAQWYPILLFWLRGYRIVGSLPLDMPHSWISFFWPNTRNQIGHIVARSERIVREFSSCIMQGRRYFRYSVWITLPLDLVVAPVCILYVFMGRFFLAKTLFASYECDACNLCVKNCPVSAIEIKEGRPYWKATCESCMRCMNICPKRAVQSWVTRMCGIAYGLMLAIAWVYPTNPRFAFCIASLMLFPLYRLLHHLWRIRAINAAFTHSSLTSVWYRYLAPGLRVKHLRARGECPKAARDDENQQYGASASPEHRHCN